MKIKYLYQNLPKYCTAETAQYLAILFLKDDEPEKALLYLNYLAQNNNIKINFSIAQSFTKEVIDLKDKLQRDSTNVVLLNKIALNYFKMQNISMAQKYSEKCLKINSRNITANEVIRKIKILPAIVP